MSTAPQRSFPSSCGITFHRPSRSRHPAIQGSRRRGPHHGRLRQNGETYKAGDPVAQSGIYEVIHAGAHRQAHEVVMLSGDVFPSCDTCQRDVRFKLVRTAPYIFQDQDFEESE